MPPDGEEKVRGSPESVAARGPDQASVAERAIRRPHPRQEPSAVVPLAGICAGAARKGGPYRDRTDSARARGEIPPGYLTMSLMATSFSFV